MLIIFILKSIIPWRKKRILVVEDDITLLEVLCYNLAKEGYEAIRASDDAEALELARSGRNSLLTDFAGRHHGYPGFSPSASSLYARR